MGTQNGDLEHMLTDSYLEGIASRSLDDVRAMRAECQTAEVGLSYLRRLAQGRLDIVHTYLEHPGGDEPIDLSALVGELPGILSAGPGRPPGPGRLPLLLTPDTEETDLTGELDDVLSADDLGRLGDLDAEALEGIAERLTAIEQRVSLQRRALHERIDVLQAELVSRYKTGRASVDGLLS